MDTVRVGVFFDGTGNNMFTDGAQENKSTLTNVASLYQGYADGSSGDTSYSKFYVSGPGTTFGTTTSDHGTSGVTDPAVIAKDSVSLANVIDGATGASSGMRVEAALAHIRQLVAEHPGAQIVVDTFGFSRGAAEGRAFINQVNTQFPGQVTVAFAGLFDTVGGYGMPGDGGTISAEAGNNLNLSEQSAGQVVHLVSADEHRQNFGLTSLYMSNGYLPPNFSEIVVPGDHSDVGGGHPTTRNTIIDGAVLRHQAEALADEYDQADPRDDVAYEVQESLFGWQVVRKEPAQSGYSAVTGELMRRLARDAGVPVSDAPFVVNSDLSPLVDQLYQPALIRTHEPTGDGRWT